MRASLILFVFSSLFTFFSAVGCSGDDSTVPSPADGGPDAVTPHDGSLDDGSGGDSARGAADGAGDAPPDDSPGEAESDGGFDGSPDASAVADATDAADATQTFEAGPPSDGVQITPPIFTGGDSLAIPLWLGGGGENGGPLVFEWANLDPAGESVTFDAISPADGGTVEVLLFAGGTDDFAALHFATNDSALIYTDPASGALYQAPLDATESPTLLAPAPASLQCQAVGADAVYAYCASGPDVSLARIPLTSDAGTFETIASVSEFETPQAIAVSGATIYVNEKIGLSDGGVGYSIEAYPAAGLGDGGAPTVVASGDGTVLQIAASGVSVCFSRTLAGSYGITCANANVPSSQEDVVPLGTPPLSGLAIDTGTLFYGAPTAIEQVPIGGLSPTKVANADESSDPTLAIDQARVYWANALGSIRAAPR